MRKCTKCGAMGHLAKWCTNKGRVQNTRSRTPQGWKDMRKPPTQSPKKGTPLNPHKLNWKYKSQRWARPGRYGGKSSGYSSVSSSNYSSDGQKFRKGTSRGRTVNHLEGKEQVEETSPPTVVEESTPFE